MNKKERNSTFELLRIIGIIMVIISHFCVHSGFLPLDITNKNFNMYLIQTLHLGTIANHIFIILSGYFLVKSTNIKLTKIIKLILEMFFYSVVIGIIFMICSDTTFSIKEIVKFIFPCFWGNWFIIYYIILYILSLYLNKFIKSIDQKTMKKLLITLIVLCYFIPSLTKNAWDFNPHTLFVVDYFIGAYFSMYGVKYSKKELIKNLIIEIILYYLLTGSMYILGGYINSNFILQNICYIIGDNYSIVSVLFAVSIFLLFTKIKFNNNFINLVASSVLGVYIIHDNELMRDFIWTKLLKNTLYINSLYFIGIMFIEVITIFVVCTIIDRLRILLFGGIEEKISTTIASYISKIFSKRTLNNNE